MLRAIALSVLLMTALPAWAATEGMGAALHDNKWADADAIAATSPDPVARKLVQYYRMLTPGAAHPAEIAAFMADNPTWPNQGLLSRRLADALATEPDDKTVLEICNRQPVREIPSLLRCAAADANAGRAPDAAEVARQAWFTGITDVPGETAFLRQWGKGLTAADQWHRFDRLAWTDNGGVGGPAWRQIARLDPSQRPAAEARLALKRDDASARALVAALPGGATVDPALMLELAKWLRRAGQDEDAQKLWIALGSAAEHAVAPDHRAAFWDERNLLARRRLRSGDAAGAYAIADGATELAPAEAIEAEFLAGFIALRRRVDTDSAARHFRALATLSPAAITQGRAYYWLGRTADARHDAAGAREAYTAAAAWPTTFYGQLAARALGEDDAALAARIRAARDPGWTPERALSFAGSENARAAAVLVEWGEPRRARSFLLRLDELAPDGTDRILAARMAVGFGLPDLAVAISRRAGRDGVMMTEAGWPMAVAPPSGRVEPALALGLIRQESNFNTEALSPVGARGLMQIMPGTAKAVANKLGETSVNIPALSTDPAYNMRLGTAYLGTLLDQFGGAIPYAVAGYNAGPGRVTDWLASNGDPATPGSLDMIDWIELIPFAETRNYVQRVVENLVIYRALAGTVLPHPLARWQG
ncbi:lytic transglycosylase domain-containing protein [Acidisphaera sp. L21]|uniref:lytic transglycosylase domain-containing protein n=1 Tax=Acidisphaera sp. L21 TaxID=1641851 RepID=UPI00131C84DB|nr:lytic transglycosylase domain-containing protein [Acidisphaera sp. L21]